MKIIHISIDEKFIDCAIDIFNELTGVDSSYFVYSKKTSLKYIKYKDILLFGSENDLIQKVNEEKCDFVILHSLCLNYKYIARIKHKIIWNSWGYDIYSDVQDFFKKAIPLPFYKPLTRNFLESVDNKSIKKKVYNSLKRLKKKICEERLYGKILHKVSYLSTVVPFEYELISKRYNHIQYCPFRYMDNLTEPEEETLVEENEQNVAKRILLGNSNDPANNHLDILCRLNDIGVKYEVVVPFSYPNNNLKYVQYVLDYSKNLKNLKISFLQDFMPYDEYFRVVKSCQTAIFGHVRQQAVGNISYMMNSGKNVFLYKDSVLYSYYKKNDYEFFSIDEDLVPQKIETPLSIAKKRNNHKKNVANHDYQAYIKKLQMFFDNLDQRK